MFTVTFYKFSKKENSTARPGGGTSFGCVLKSVSSVLSPTIEIDVGTVSRPDYNYAYIPDYGRYYWVRDWTWINNRIWEASLEVDVLATYKDEIGGSTLYVVRSASDYDGAVVDDLYPITAQVTANRNLVTREKAYGSTYILGVYGSDNSNTGMVTLYALNDTAFQRLKEYLFNDDVSASTNPLGALAQEIGDALSKSIIDPMQYFCSCMWFPYTIGGTAVGTIKCGYFDIPMEGYGARKLAGFNASDFSNTGSVVLPKHPLAASKGIYLNQYPYSRYCLFMHPYGAIELDTSLLAESASVTFDEWIDLMSGIGIMTVYRADGRAIAYRTAQVGVNVPLTQAGTDIITTAGSIVTAAGAAMAGNYLGAVGAVGSAIRSINQNSMTMGGVGGSSGYRLAPFLTSYHYGITGENNPDHGRPLMQLRTIGNLSGYIEVDHGDVATTGTAVENEQIKSYLESGFYYE